MAKLYDVNESDKQRRNRNSAKNDRFYSQLDMSIIKHDAAVKNSQIKRGETVDKPNNYISVCGCGAVGCFIHGSFENSPKAGSDETGFYRGGKGISIELNLTKKTGRDYRTGVTENLEKIL